MIAGWFPQVCLAVLSVGSLLSLCLYRRGWWRVAEGQYLVVFTAIVGVWWSLVGVATILGRVPAWLQIAEAVAFFLMAVGVLWCLTLQIVRRKRKD